MRSWTTRALTDRLALFAGLGTTLGLIVWFGIADSPHFLMPGPLTSAHSAITDCGSCHTASGTSRARWLHGLVAANPRADSTACLTCHAMPDSAFNPHGASSAVLNRSTERQSKVAVQLVAPVAARAQRAAFPATGMIGNGLPCATCHQEHQGAGFDLAKISNEQCRTCHVIAFDSFDGAHPKFDAYPFERRTRIIYDHAGHFDKHYPELVAKDPTKPAPQECASCHNSKAARRVMGVAPFERTCATCHLGQITGKDRVSGPKGIAFLSVPGLDLATLKAKGAVIGTWPEDSDAALTPFMQLMIGRTPRGRDMLAAVEGLDLQNLSSATPGQIEAVGDLVWEIKALFHKLMAGKPSDAFGDLGLGGPAPVPEPRIADLTAGLPRDVLANAVEAWLPGLAAEIVGGPDAAAAAEQPVESPVEAPEPEATDDPDPEVAPPQDDAEASAAESTATAPVKRDPPACTFSVLGQCLVQGEPPAEPPPAPADSSAAPLQQQVNGKVDLLAGALDKAKPKDELLDLTEDERRALDEHAKRSGGKTLRSTKPRSSGTIGDTGTSSPDETPVPSVDAEGWAEYGGWYSQDHVISYRPAGHKDRFIATWLALTGPAAIKGSKTPAAAVFAFLINKDAPGSCANCHSVDAMGKQGQFANFAPMTVDNKRGMFTRFIHEPHFGIMENGGCLTCHALDRTAAYLTSYAEGEPRRFQSAFASIKKETCTSCHSAGMARQDCLTCHDYHVNGVVSPITTTKNSQR